MKIKTNWNLGNFTVALAVEESQAFALEVLAPLGLRFLGQRNAEVDKILGGYVKKGDKLVRRPGFKRNEVEYSEGLAKRLAASFESLSVPGSEDEIVAEAAVSEYVREVAAIKYRDAKECAGMHESAGDIEEWAEKNLGYTGPTHGEDEEYAEEMLRIIHAKLVAKKKETLLAI